MLREAITLYYFHILIPFFAFHGCQEGIQVTIQVFNDEIRLANRNKSL